MRGTLHESDDFLVSCSCGMTGIMEVAKDGKRVVRIIMYFNIFMTTFYIPLSVICTSYKMKTCAAQAVSQAKHFESLKNDLQHAHFLRKVKSTRETFLSPIL